MATLIMLPGVLRYTKQRGAAQGFHGVPPK
jgi:hypothetical protein